MRQRVPWRVSASAVTSVVPKEDSTLVLAARAVEQPELMPALPALGGVSERRSEERSESRGVGEGEVGGDRQPLADADAGVRHQRAVVRQQQRRALAEVLIGSAPLPDLQHERVLVPVVEQYEGIR